jgi:hypothetical protein
MSRSLALAKAWNLTWLFNSGNREHLGRNTLPYSISS